MRSTARRLAGGVFCLPSCIAAAAVASAAEIKLLTTCATGMTKP